MATPTPARAPLAAMTLATTPRSVRRLAQLAFVAIPLLILGLFLLPWTQSAFASGRVTAFDPVYRPQPITSNIEGRVIKWHVVEGQRVRAGELLVEMIDNDAELLRRLQEEESQVQAQYLSVQGGIQNIQSRITFLRLSQQQLLVVEEQQIIIAGNEVDRAMQAAVAAASTFEQAKLDLPRVVDLEKKGLATRRELEAARQRYEAAEAQAKAADITVTNARETLKRVRENKEAVRASTDALIKGEDAVVQRETGNLANAERQRLAVQSRIERQRQQDVRAPADGRIFRLLANGEGGGQLVRAGERLAILVPDIRPPEELSAGKIASASVVGGSVVGGGLSALTPGPAPAMVAELLIDGNDLPLVRVGDRVRLQFEGWPAVQFVGWPSAAVGTFAGRVYLIDPNADDRNGRFRILVEPDVEAAKTTEPVPHTDRLTGWPTDDYLRQGVRVQGWVLFDRVPLWWEAFRQLNGFPPTRTPSSKLAGGTLGPVGK